ncbi:MAG: hypothetical protein HZA12_05210 [Nitrospirae bacterium]|nr:hypothetical protein [Nitrospirota bacterium]
MKIKLISVVFAVIILGAWQSPAEAACTYTAVQVGPVPSEVTMGGTATLTLRITNTVTVGGGCAATDRIYQVRFQIAGTRSTFNVASTVPPAGWNTDPGKSTTTQMYFMANSWADSILPGAFKDFNFVINAGTSTADVTETLKQVRARWTNQTTAFPAPPSEPTQTKSVNCTTAACKGSWTLKSLSMTLVPSTFNVGTGCTFTLTMTVTNKSTSAITGVTSVTYPPTRTGVSATTTSNPGTFNLNAGATGTMVWTYTAGSTAGTLTFTAYAQDSAGKRTSSSVTTSPITVSTGISCNFTAVIAVTPCLFSGDMATFVMTVTNNTGNTASNIVPSALMRFGTAVISTFTGPSPASIASIANGASGTFTWTAPVTGSTNQTYYVTGNATATGPITTTIATSTTGRVGGYPITVSPASTNAGSTNEELTWSVTNYGCADINSVAITIPGGWTYGGDSYSFIDPTGLAIETWIPSGTVTFTADAPGNRIVASSNSVGEFHLVFSQTPSATGANTFNVIITDASATPNITTVPTTVTVNAFNNSVPGSGNYTLPEVWRESY